MSSPRIRGFVTDLDVATDPAAMKILQRDLAAIYTIGFPPGSEEAFRFKGTTWQFSNAFLHTTTGPAMTMQRSQAHVARNPIDQVSIFHLVHGSVSAVYDGVENSLAPGDLLFVDYMKPMTSETTAFASRSLTLARSAVPTCFQDGSMHGTILRANDPVNRMLASHFATLVDLVDGLATHEAQTALDAFVALTGTLWPERTSVPPAKETAVALKDRAMTLIRDNLSDPGLSPAEIAFSLSVSRASLYAHFQAHGGVSAVIQKMRLDESLKSLVQGSAVPGFVTEIAKRFGFRSGAHFSRAFSARFGRSPRDVALLSGDAAGGLTYARWLAEHRHQHSPEMIVGWLEATDAVFERDSRSKASRRKAPVSKMPR